MKSRPLFGVVFLVALMSLAIGCDSKTTGGGSGGDAQVAGVSTGLRHTCRLLEDATVALDGEYVDPEATAPPEVTTFVDLSSGPDHTCGVESDGAAQCCRYEVELIDEAAPVVGQRVVSRS